jgi:hypothetical protein
MAYEKLTVNKLFYGEYAYKIECNVGANLHWLRHQSIERLKKAYHDRKSNKTMGVLDPIVDYDFYKFLCAFEPFANDVKHRIECHDLGIFIKDKESFDQIAKSLKQWVTKIYEPANEAELALLLQSPRKIKICDKLPYSRYKYCVHLRYETAHEIRKNFLLWIANYDKRIYIANASKQWCEGVYLYNFTPFFYVEDSPTLSMIGLYLGGSIQKVEEFVTRESINTTL